MLAAPQRVTLLYWGRRGALNRLTLELARAAALVPGLSATFSVSRQNDSFSAFEALGANVLPVDTFESTLGAIAGARHLPALRRTLAARLAEDRTQTVIALMPHVWSQLMIDTVHAAGARYVTVVHDATHHPGDIGAQLHRWLLREARRADHVITLSRAVAADVRERVGVPDARVSPLFLPDIVYGCRTPLAMTEPASRTNPLRLLFFGRVLSYKGLPRLIDAVEQLQRQGIAVTLSVYGHGNLQPLRPRLAALGASIVNRWIDEPEVAGVLGNYHAVVLSHTEASQSGVAAAALGAGVPVIAVPVGGIVEQIRHGETGLLAARPDTTSLADTIAALAFAPGLHRRLCEGIVRTAPERSAARFLSELLAAASAERLSPHASPDSWQRAGV